MCFWKVLRGLMIVFVLKGFTEAEAIKLFANIYLARNSSNT